MSTERGAVKSSWALILGTGLIALLPVAGFVTWVIAAPVILITFILAIVALAKGQTGDGVAILLASMALPVWLFFAPMLTTAGFGAMASEAARVQAERETYRAKRVPAPEPVVSIAAAAPRSDMSTPSPASPPRVTQPVATPSQRLFRSEAEARAEAVRLYPAVAVANSPFNVAFLEAVGRARRDRPHLLNNPAWPVMMAEEAAKTGAPAR